MGSSFSIEKKKGSKSRKMPFLPRIGIYIDVAGYEVIFKKVPILEALLNLPDENMTLRSLAKATAKITKAQLAEIQFPKLRRGKVIDASARTLSSDVKA